MSHNEKLKTSHGPPSVSQPLNYFLIGCDRCYVMPWEVPVKDGKIKRGKENTEGADWLCYRICGGWRIGSKYDFLFGGWRRSCYLLGELALVISENGTRNEGDPIKTTPSSSTSVSWHRRYITPNLARTLYLLLHAWTVGGRVKIFPRSQYLGSSVTTLRNKNKQAATPQLFLVNAAAVSEVLFLSFLRSSSMAITLPCSSSSSQLSFAHTAAHRQPIFRHSAQTSCLAWAPGADWCMATAGNISFTLQRCSEPWNWRKVWGWEGGDEEHEAHISHSSNRDEL